MQLSSNEAYARRQKQIATFVAVSPDVIEQWRQDYNTLKVPAAWKDKPAWQRQKDRDALWIVKFSRVKLDEEGNTRQRDIAMPAFGYPEK